MNIIWFSALFLLFGVIYYLVGVAASHKVHTDHDYFLAGRSLGFWPLTATLLATQLGGGMILGTAAHAYNLGWPGIFYSLGMSIGFLVLGLGIAGKLRSFNISTTAELFEKQFGSKSLRKVASFLSILALSGIFIAQVVSSKSLMIGLGVHNDIVFIAFWLLLIGYTMYGGLPAVVATDVLQVIIILSVFGYVFLSMLWQGTVDVAVLSTSFIEGKTASYISDYWFIYIGMPLMFSLVEQDLAQRFFAARSQAVAVWSSLVAGVSVLLTAAIPVCLGIQARLSGIEVVGDENPLISFLALHMNEFVYALVMCALIAAIASTADSLLCAISSNVVQDFIPHDTPNDTRMWASRSATVVVGLSGVIGAYFFTDILHVLTESYQLLVSTVLVAVLACFINLPRVPRAAAWSVVGGFSTYVICVMTQYSYGVPRPVLALAVSALGYLIGMLTAFNDRHVSKGS